MPNRARIIVVSPEPAVQVSLCFMLEVEGYAVRALDTLGDAVILGENCDCAVVDHKAISKSRRTNELAVLAWPIVLLVDRKIDFSVQDDICIVEKPLLGNAVVEAVRTAISRPGQASIT